MSEPPSFVFGVDLDGVCADHTRAFRQVVAEARGVAPETLPLERSWDFSEWGFGPDDFEEYHRLAVNERRMFRWMPVLEGCVDALWRLSDAGVWIRIVTHRLYVNWGHGVAAADTVAWLDENRIPYRDLCFLGAKSDVACDAYVDDAPHNVAALRGTGADVIVFDQPYNARVDGPRAMSWEQVEAFVHESASRKGIGLRQQLAGFDAGADRLTRRRLEQRATPRPDGASF